VSANVGGPRGCASTSEVITPNRAITIILAHGVVRLHQRQKELDNSTEQTLQNVADRPMFLLDAMKSKAVRGEPYVLNT
jgi:hypothetical protein